jgi:hypothetical protein
MVLIRMVSPRPPDQGISFNICRLLGWMVLQVVLLASRARDVLAHPIVYRVDVPCQQIIDCLVQNINSAEA